MGLAVDGANHQDMKLVRAMVDSLPVARPAPSLEYPQGLCLDKGYDFDEVRRTLDESEERCSVMTSTGGVHSPFINNPRMGTVVMQGLGSGPKSNLLDLRLRRPIWHSAGGQIWSHPRLGSSHVVRIKFYGYPLPPQSLSN